MSTPKKNDPPPDVSEDVAVQVDEPRRPDDKPKGRSRRITVDDTNVDKVRVDNAKVDDAWKRIIESRRERLDSDVLAIAPPRTKLDPIAQGALEVLVARLGERRDVGAHADRKGAARAFSFSSPTSLERELRAFIVSNGIASEVKKVTERLNARRITGGRLWVLRTTYPYLLAKLFAEEASRSVSRDGKNRDGNGRIEAVKRLVEDDLGVAEKVLLDLAAEGGPLDVFAELVVQSVMKRNRIEVNPMRLHLVSQYVRSAI